MSYFFPAFFGVLLGALLVRGSVRTLQKKGPLGEVLLGAIVFGGLEVAVHLWDRPQWVSLAINLCTFGALCAYLGAKLKRS